MFDMLQLLPASRPLELTQASIDVFPWWLWLPTIDPIRDDVIGVGIARIALVETWARSTGYTRGAMFLIVHTDKTALLLSAFHGEGRRNPYQHEILEASSHMYKSLLNWKRWNSTELSGGLRCC